MNPSQPETPVAGVTFEQWIESEDSARYQGRHIAYVQGEGVIGHASSLDALTASLAGHPRRREVILDFVPIETPVAGVEQDQ